MTENSEDLYPVDYPDKPSFTKHSEELLAASSLIKSHLFCVDNLTIDGIQECLASEDNDGMKPVRYDGQYLENAYHYWIYPNYDDSLYSKVLARANAVGDLVIGTGEETCLVIIRHGRLTITTQPSDDVANVSDARLLVCL